MFPADLDASPRLLGHGYAGGCDAKVSNVGDYGTDLRRRLGEVFASGTWLCTSAVGSRARQMPTQVAELAGFKAGASARSPVAGIAMFGTDPTPQAWPPVVALNRPRSGNLVADLLRLPGLWKSLNEHEQKAIDAADPDHSARVLVLPIMSDKPIAGRPTFGARPVEWLAFEDKLAIVELWQRAAVPMAPSRNVALDQSGELFAAHRELSSARGSVWAVDNSNGFHGGAVGTFLVPDSDTATSVAERLRGEGYGAVRIMPFLSGVPCSIHGVVFDDKTVALRPNEMLVFVDKMTNRFTYARASNFWDPEPRRRAEMAKATIDIGDELREAADFRGVFSLDGVMTDDGFRPTEVNPRYGVALPTQVPAGEGNTINLFLLNMAIVEGAITVDANRFGRWLVSTLDNNRAGSSFVATANKPDTTTSGVIVAAESAQSETAVGTAMDVASTTLSLIETEARSDPAHPAAMTDTPGVDQDRILATVEWSDDGGVGLLTAVLGDGFPVGQSAAAWIQRFFELVDNRWQCEIAILVPAASLR